MFETIFTLKQHTPMLHFLHDQPDATLRATELKPKLDRFIAEQLSHKIPDDWVAKNHDGHKALDYKMVIEPIGKKIEGLSLLDKNEWGAFKAKNFSHVLANVGVKTAENAKSLILYEHLLVTVNCWDQELLMVVQKWLPELLVSQNFGNRSSKGFGSFACIKRDDLDVNLVPKFAYFFDWKVKEKDKRGNLIQKNYIKTFRQENLFEALNYFYRCIRSGINEVKTNRDNITKKIVSTRTDFYFKSLLYSYANMLDPTQKWDKYIIKNHFFKGGALPEIKNDYRDWLGLSTDELWRIPKSNHHKGEIHYNSYSIKKESTNTAVERFPSPITFKPIWIGGDDGYWRIYFGITQDKKVMDEFKAISIRVTAAPSSDKNRENDIISTQNLQLKPVDGFDPMAFLNFVFDFKNKLDHHVKLFSKSDAEYQNYINHWLFRAYIKPIFTSLTKNPAAK